MSDWLTELRGLCGLAAADLHGEEAYIFEGDLVRFFKDHADRLLAAAELAEAVSAHTDNVVRKIEADERFHYPPADVWVNAPLALIQVELKAIYATAKQVQDKCAAYRASKEGHERPTER